VLFHVTIQLLLMYEKHDLHKAGKLVVFWLPSQIGLPHSGTAYVAARMLLCLENWHLTKQYSEVFMAVLAGQFCLPGKNGFIPKVGK
jgi:hypothetical protein